MLRGALLLGLGSVQIVKVIQESEGRPAVGGSSCVAQVSPTASKATCDQNR